MSALTCGAMTDHSHKMKAGGLLSIEKDIEQHLEELVKRKITLLQCSQGMPSLETIRDVTEFQDVLEQSRKAFENIEKLYIDYTFRHILCTSQVYDTFFQYDSQLLHYQNILYVYY